MGWVEADEWREDGAEDDAFEDKEDDEEVRASRGGWEVLGGEEGTVPGLVSPPSPHVPLSSPSPRGALTTRARISSST